MSRSQKKATAAMCSRGLRTKPRTPNSFGWRPITPPGPHSQARAAASTRATCFSSCRTSLIRFIWSTRKQRPSRAATQAFQLHPSHWRSREGFNLTDPGTDLTGALSEAHYCIKCHNQGKDSCSTGMREKTGEFKHSYFGVTLNGCPLEEKISEMNVAKQNGNPIGALAIVDHR